MLYSIAAMVIGYKFILSTVALNFDIGGEYDFTVLTYNTRIFNAYDHLNEQNQSSKKIIDWVKNDESDIKCIQEFYNKSDSKIFNTTSKLQQNGAYYSYTQPRLINKGQEFGLAIFSKFPIVNKGRIEFKEKSKNDAIYADVLIQKDTVRVINVHLESMSIAENIFEERLDFKTNVKNLTKKLRIGFVARAQQLAAVEKYITNCRHRVILCGDLNDPPYSYTYLKLQSMLESGFEQAANGFGFSYNGNLFFLRIDNQFHSEGLKPTNYFTLREVTYSDHFPVKAHYKFQSLEQ